MLPAPLPPYRVLTGLVDRFGRTQTFHREAAGEFTGEITGVTDGAGRQFRLVLTTQAQRAENARQQAIAAGTKGSDIPDSLPDYTEYGRDNGIRLSGVWLTHDPEYPENLPAAPLVRYDWTARGELAAVYDRSGTQMRHFTYDDKYRGRMVAHRYAGRPEMRYRYDDIGRVTEQFNPAGLSYAYQYEKNRITINRITEDAHYLYRYDRYGRLTEKTDRIPTGVIRTDDERPHHYHHDSQHRLVFYTRIQHEEPLVESRYLYDPLGRRTGKRVWRRERDLTGWMSLSRKPEVTWYGWDGDRLTTVQTDTKRIQTVYQPGSFTPLIRIETENGELQKAQRRSLAEKLQQEGSEDGHGVVFPAELVRMLDRLEGEIRADRVSSESRQWLAQCGLTVERLAAQIEPVYLPERKIHLYHCDHRGLPLALISTEGATEWRGEYDEWGNQLNEENPHHLFQPYRLPGQQYDDESGLCYNRYRYYEPLQGRYITQDPIGLNGGWNLYKYPLNPINYADPLGLAVDINHFPVNEDIRNYAEKVWNNPNIITIGTHGDPQSVYDENYNKIDVKTLANEVRNHPKFKPGMSVRLLSCNTGKGNNSYAQQLADELGVRVYAPDQYDWYYSNGKVEPWGGFYDANNQLQMDTNQPGHEFTFKRRKP